MTHLQILPYGMNAGGRRESLTEHDYFHCQNLFKDSFFNHLIIIIRYKKKKAKLRPQEALTSWPLDYASHVLIYESLRMQRNQPQKHKSPLALILGQTKMPPPHPEKEALAGSLGSLQQSTALWKENPPKALPEQPSACFSHDDLQGTHTLHQRPNGTAAHCHLRSFVS